MKFVVARTSGSREVCPVKGAKRETIVAVDVRNVKTLEEARNSRWAQSFFRDNKRNFREEGGYVKADYDAQEWTIEIDSLEDLLRFADKHGELVLSPIGDGVWGARDYPRLEIYDGYRE